MKSCIIYGVQLILLPKNKLDNLGLIDDPWIVRDPENTRYIQQNTQSFLIQNQNKICGFLVQHGSESKKIIDYLIFSPVVNQKEIDRFCKKKIFGTTVYITTYDKNFKKESWERRNFKIKLGQQFMEKSLLNLLKMKKSSSEIQFKKQAWPKDIEIITTLYKKCFPKNEWKYLHDFQSDPYAEKSTIFVAEKNGQAIGLWIHTIYDKNISFLCWLGVIRQLRGQGIATQMLHYGSQLAKEGGCQKLALLVQPHNLVAKQFYQKHGFKPSWQRIHLISC